MTITTSEYVVPGQLTSCRLGATVNIDGVYNNGINGIGATITTFSPTLNLDTVDVEEGDSVLIAHQTNAYENGIYVVSNLGRNVILTRRSDFQTPSQMLPGLYFSLSAGSFAGLFHTVEEPQVVNVGVDSPHFANSTGGIVTNPTTVNLVNSGLNVFNPGETFLNHIVPSSAITANRTFQLVTGDQNTSLDISGAQNVTVSAYGGTLTSQATKLSALTALGVKRGTTAAFSGGTASNAYVATGLLSTDIVVASILSVTNPDISILLAIPTTDTLTIFFSGAPGVNTVVNWIAVATV